jgi:hypothetical protein
MNLLTQLCALITLWIICPILLSYGLLLVYRQWRADREQKRKWAEEGVKQHSVRERRIYLEKL